MAPQLKADALVIGFDPGKTTGIATYGGHGNFIGSGELAKYTLYRYLESFRDMFDMANISKIIWIIETYRIRPPKSKTEDPNIWKSPETLKIQGVIEYFAEKHGIATELQEPAIKSLGYGFAGLEYRAGKSGPGYHSKDARAHVAYYLVSKQGVSPAVLAGKVPS
jgi:hypothetical protein